MLPVRKSERVVQLGDDDEVSIKRVPVVPENTLSPKDVLNDIKYFNNSSKFTSVRNDLELQKKKEKFIAKITPALDKLKQLNLIDDDIEKLFYFVLQSSEDYFNITNAENCDKVKNEVCVQLLCPFVNNDEKLCKQIIRLIAPTVKKLTMYRKVKKNLKKIVFFCLSMVFVK